MSNESDTNSTYTGASPWPLFVALGLALSEVGVVLGLRPVSIAGLLLFVGSVAGILTEAGYVSRPARAAGVQGVALVGIGITLVLQNQTGTTVRGQSIAIAGVLSLLGALLWVGFIRTRARDSKTATESTETTSD
jgi:membrane-bound ClpP family serine protease